MNFHLYNPGADPENFSRGGPMHKYEKKLIFSISSNIGDIKICKFQGGPDPPSPPLDPRMYLF